MEDFAKWLQAECERTTEGYVRPEEARRQQMQALRNSGVPQRTIVAYEVSRMRVRTHVALTPRRTGRRTSRRRALAAVRCAPARGDPDDDGGLDPPDLIGGAP
jgi:hypothetical protein